MQATGLGRDPSPPIALSMVDTVLTLLNLWVSVKLQVHFCALNPMYILAGSSQAKLIGISWQVLITSHAPFGWIHCQLKWLARFASMVQIGCKWNGRIDVGIVTGTKALVWHPPYFPGWWKHFCVHSWSAEGRAQYLHDATNICNKAICLPSCALTGREQVLGKVSIWWILIGECDCLLLYALQ